MFKMLNRDVENIKKDTNQTSRSKNYRCEMKNALDGMKTRLDVAEGSYQWTLRHGDIWNQTHMKKNKNKWLEHQWAVG